MKKNAFTLTEILIGVAILALAALILFPLFARARDNLHHGSCSSNLKQIGLGLLQYTQDYDQKLPILTTQQGWFGALQPYVKSTRLFQCPDEKESGDDKLIDYWFNQRLAGVEGKQIFDDKNTLMCGDGEPSDDPNASLTALPPLWRTKEDSPARRHFSETAFYLFADGHVRQLAPDKITIDKPSQRRPTFLLR